VLSDQGAVPSSKCVSVPTGDLATAIWQLTTVTGNRRLMT